MTDILNVIIPHFKQHKLQSAKTIDFNLFLKCVQLMAKKQHLTESGLNELLSIRSILNWGLTEKLKLNFPGIKPAVRPEYVIDDNPLDPNWFSGFSEGESSFYVVPGTKNVRVVFEIHLNVRELPLIQKIQKFLGGIGKIRISDKSHSVHYTIYSISDLEGVIVPHFNKYK